MIEIKPCRPYHAKTIGKTLLKMPDGKSAFKVYFISIVGRDDRARFEWDHSALKSVDFQAAILKSGWEGIGFVTAFPHITKEFRFAPDAETILHVRAFQTRDLKPLDLGRGEQYLEFACYAEAAIAADEYRAWARAGDVKEYLRFFSDFEDGPVKSCAKLAAYWKSQVRCAIPVS